MSNANENTCCYSRCCDDDRGPCFGGGRRHQRHVTGQRKNGLAYTDLGNDTDATAELRNWASRLNLQGDTDIGSGLMAFGRYELSVDTSSTDNGNGAFGTRHAYVGLKGDFGELLAGQTYHTFYDHVLGPVDQPWWGSCNGCLGEVGRTSQGVKYSNSSGPISGGATLYFQDGGEEILDGFELAGTYDAGVVKVGFGVQDFDRVENDPDLVFGVTVSGKAGEVNYAAAFTSQGAPENGGEDTTGFDVYAALGRAYVDVGMIDVGDISPFGVTLGYSRIIGPQTLAWFEVQATDPDISGLDTILELRAALKYDWE